MFHKCLCLGLLCLSMFFTTAAMPREEVKLQEINSLAAYVQKIQTNLSDGVDRWQERIISTQKPSYTKQEIEMVSAVVMMEGGYMSRDTKIALTNVILNRLKSGIFGSTLYEVLHAPGQFDAIRNYYRPVLPPDALCREAVLAALKGEDNSKGALYYCNPELVYSPKAKRWFASLTFVFELEGQKFYR